MKILASILTGLFLLSSPTENKPKPNKDVGMYISNHENILGTSVSLKITSSTQRDAEKAELLALTEINRLSAIFSSYDQNSEFNKWLKQDLNTPIKVSNELFEMLDLFAKWKTKSNGALDASAQVAIKLWNEAALKQDLPTKEAIDVAVRTMKSTSYSLNDQTQTVTRLNNTPLVINSFAKSYIINKACESALSAANINAVVINAGGDLVIKGDLKDEVFVTNPLASADNDKPLDLLNVQNKAIATSGNYRRGVQIGDHWYSHIIDPRSAKPVEGVISATVIADDATEAGALATAFNVLSISESKALAAQSPGVAYLIITKNGERVASENWQDYTVPAEDTKLLKNEKKHHQKLANKPWDAKFELSISFDFNKIEGNTHRPFTAIWVENEQKVVVRNLALWYNKTKWIPDLRNWYRINGERFKANKDNFASVTGATRNPGKYTVKWDGKDDKGNHVAQGKYTVMIETSKEHGTDEILRQSLELKKSPVKAVNKGNVEISNVTFEFYKK